MVSSGTSPLEAPPLLPASLPTPGTVSQSKGIATGAAQPAALPLKLETTCLTEQERQAQLWPSAVIHAATSAAKLRSIGRIEEANKLDDCHTRWTFAQCKSCRAVQQFPNRCENFFCAKCQPYLARKRKRAVEWWARSARQAKHVVLTVQNVSDLTLEHVQQLKKWFRALRRTKFASNWIGGFYSLEVTNEGNGWHLHIHAMVDAMWIDSFGLSTTWSKVTNGMGKIVKVKDARQRDYLAEVVKYAVKGNQLAAWCPRDIATFVDSFTGVRAFGVFGSLYGKRTEWKQWLAGLKKHGNTCECGCTEFWYFTETEWLLLDLQPSNPTQANAPPRTDEPAQLYLGVFS